jgi:hypothetical protein
MPEASLVVIQISAPAIVRRGAFGAQPASAGETARPVKRSAEGGPLNDMRHLPETDIDMADNYLNMSAIATNPNLELISSVSGLVHAMVSQSIFYYSKYS